jgi:hypothetical protein
MIDYIKNGHDRYYERYLETIQMLPKEDQDNYLEEYINHYIWDKRFDNLYLPYHVKQAFDLLSSDRKNKLLTVFQQEANRVCENKDTFKFIFELITNEVEDSEIEKSKYESVEAYHTDRKIILDCMYNDDIINNSKKIEKIIEKILIKMTPREKEETLMELFIEHKNTWEIHNKLEPRYKH